MFSSRRIFEKFRIWSLLPSSSLPPKPPLMMLKFLKGAGVGKEAQLPMKANPFEDALTIRDVSSQAKKAGLKS